MAKKESVTLKNVTRRYLVFNLPHKEYCGDGACICERSERVFAERDHLARTTTNVVREHLICQSTGWLAGEVKEVSPRYLKVSAIARAVQKGELIKQ